MISSLRPALARLRPAGGVSLPSPDVLRNLVPLFMLAALVTALVLMWLWRDQSSFKPVFGEREKVAVTDMMAVLDAEGIAYRLHPESGQVLVAGDQLGRVRMLLAAKGVVAQLPAGLELMDRDDPLGVSQFVQDVRFRRGLEGELAQSITTLDAVASARVHLSIAKSSSFVVSDGSKSSAAVVVTLRPGRTLNGGQVAAIINMVAGSVASLDPQRVSLVDQAGNLLSAQIDLSDGVDAVALGGDMARRYREEARANVRELLAPVLGDNNFKVSVAALVDNDRVQETREQYGDTPRVVSEAMREESGRSAMAIGVPGSLSNQPVDAAQAKAQGEANAKPDAQKAATTRQYAYDRSVTQVQRSRGRLSKLQVAVILNSAAAPSGDGVWSEAALANVERVLRSGLGIDEARGDTLAVSAMAFPPPPEVLPWWQERDTLIDVGGYATYALGALLAYLLLFRPALRLAQRGLERPRPAVAAHGGPAELAPPATAAAPALAAPSSAAAVGEVAALAEATEPARRDGAMPVVPLLENYDLPPPGSPVDVMVDHLKVLAAKEPERVAEVVKQWVQSNGRSEQNA